MAEESCLRYFFLVSMNFYGFIFINSSETFIVQCGEVEEKQTCSAKTYCPAGVIMTWYYKFLSNYYNATVRLEKWKRLKFSENVLLKSMWETVRVDSWYAPESVYYSVAIS